MLPHSIIPRHLQLILNALNSLNHAHKQTLKILITPSKTLAYSFSLKLTQMALNAYFCRNENYNFTQLFIQLISMTLILSLIHSHSLSYLFLQIENSFRELLCYLCTHLHSNIQERPQFILWYLLCETVTWHLHTLLGSIFFCERGNSLPIWRDCCTLCTLGSHRTHSGSSFVPRERNQYIFKI